MLSKINVVSKEMFNKGHAASFTSIIIDPGSVGDGQMLFIELLNVFYPEK